jgi:hypothetical protein
MTGETLEVDVLSVPSLLWLMEWERFDLLKIDIEGSEKEVLGGHPPWLEKVRCIIGEDRFLAGYTIEACRGDLEPMGFEVRQLVKSVGTLPFLARRPD